MGYNDAGVLNVTAGGICTYIFFSYFTTVLQSGKNSYVREIKPVLSFHS